MRHFYTLVPFPALKKVLIILVLISLAFLSQFQYEQILAAWDLFHLKLHKCMFKLSNDGQYLGEFRGVGSAGIRG